MRDRPFGCGVYIIEGQEVCQDLQVSIGANNTGVFQKPLPGYNPASGVDGLEVGGEQDAAADLDRVLDRVQARVAAACILLITNFASLSGQHADICFRENLFGPEGRGDKR